MGLKTTFEEKGQLRLIIAATWKEQVKYLGITLVNQMKVYNLIDSNLMPAARMAETETFLVW